MCSRLCLRLVYGLWIRSKHRFAAIDVTENMLADFEQVHTNGHTTHTILRFVGFCLSITITPLIRKSSAFNESVTRYVITHMIAISVALNLQAAPTGCWSRKRSRTSEAGPRMTSCGHWPSTTCCASSSQCCFQSSLNTATTKSTSPMTSTRA